MKTIGGEWNGAVRQVGMAGGEVSVAQGEFAAAMDTEPAAAAELLIDAKASARGMGDVGGGAFDLIGRGAQFDQAGGANLSQRECARELRTLLRFELSRHAEQSPGTNLAPMVEAVLRLDVIGGPSVQECTLNSRREFTTHSGRRPCRRSCG